MLRYITSTMNHIERIYWERDTRRVKRRRKVHLDVTSTINWQFLSNIRIMTSMIILCVCFASSHAAFQDYDFGSLTPSQGFTIFSGGTTISDAGDMNGDGFGDIAVGIPFMNANSGMAFIVFGNASGINSNQDLNAFVTGPTAGFRILPVSSAGGGRLGYAINSAGDVNGDGIDDIIIGAWGENLSLKFNAGVSYVIFGRRVTSPNSEFTDIQLPNAEMEASMGFRILGAAAYDFCGFSVSGAGDVNHDGIDDVIVGSLKAYSDSGIVHVIFGKNLTGSSLSFGDVDLFSFESTSTFGFRIVGAAQGDFLGHGLSRAGDINGDGISDIILGAFLADPPTIPTRPNAGIVYVIFGNEVPLDTEWDEIQLTSAVMAINKGFRIFGAASDAQTGLTISNAGDVNSDGTDDIIIGAPEADPPSLGANSNGGISYVIFGRNVAGGAPAFLDIDLASISSGSTIGFRLLGASTNSMCGLAVSNAGDFNGDGIDDLLVGAQYDSKTTNFFNAGVTYLIYGRRQIVDVDVFNDIDLATFVSSPSLGLRVFGSTSNEESGCMVSTAGDVNSDGLSDIIISSYGPSFVIYGSPFDPTSQPSSQPSLQPTSAPSTQELSLSHLDNSRGFKMSLGSTVSAAGDLNGDGVDDMIVGVSYANENAGIVYVVFGNTNNLIEDIDFATRVTGPTTGFRILAPEAYNSLGVSVSKAGDVNGDGEDDVILGAHGSNPYSRWAAGISYVIFGRKVTSPSNAFGDIQLPATPIVDSTGFRILGVGLSDLSGASVSGAGDVNGDGIDDVIVGAFCADPPLLTGDSNGGIAYIVFGKNMTGSALAFGDVDLALIISGSALGVRILAVGAGDQLGLSVSRAGDVNHDGISDVIVAARNADPMAPGFIPDGGVSYVIFGHKMTTAPDDIQLTDSALPSQIGFRIIGAEANDFSGSSVSSAGDINGDGIDDIIVGAQFADPPALSFYSDAGITYVIYGRNVAGGTPAFGDILLSSIVTGSTIGFRILGAAAGDNSGWQVSNAGDVNGDGVSDVVIGACNADPQPSKVNAGISYVIYGRKSIAGNNPFSDINLAALYLGSSVGFRILGAKTNDQSGNSVSSAGDINGDGFDDVMVGTSWGPSYVIYGAPVSPTSQPSSQPSRQPSRQPTSQPSRQPSTQPSCQPSRQPASQPTSAPSTQELSLSHLDYSLGFKMSLGSAVSASGDLNGDGIDDVVVGASGFSGNTGTAYVVFGNENAVFGNVDFNARVTGQTTGFRILAAGIADSFGISVSKAGDVNGDGVDDVILGANGADLPGKQNSGVSYVIFGRKVTSAANAFTDIQLPTVAMAAGVGFRILGAAGSDLSGASVSGAGDVNGDGIDDVIIGANLADPPNLPASSDAGIAYVVFGRNMTGNVAAFGDVELSSIVTGSSLGFRILAVGGGDQLGLSVSRAGDVNHDGISDIIVAARNADPANLAANSNAGISYVILGRNVTSPANAFTDIQLTSSSLPSEVGFRIIGAAVNDNVGSSVSGAGDVNGDGIDDIIVGAVGADPPTRANAGIAYVIYGRNVASGAPAFGDIFLSTILAGSTIGFRVLGAAGGDQCGNSVASAGDVNGDGVSDIIIGAVFADSKPSKADAGISYVIYGRKSFIGVNPFSDIDLTTLYLGSSVGFRILGAAAQDKSGNSVSGAGDINGDGYDDVMIGTNSGPSHLIFGGPVSPTSQPSSQPSRQPSSQPSRQPSMQPSTQPSRQPSRQPTSQPTSAPSTQELSLSHLDNTRGFKMSLGSAVSSAGDLNGDGVDDVIVGASWSNANTGVAYVVFGDNMGNIADIDFSTRATGLTTGFRILPTAQGGMLGYSVSKAGDVNGDGVDDVVLGAYLMSPDGSRNNAGISYVIFGRKVTTAANAFTDIQLPSTALAVSVGFRILGATLADRSGISVSSAGDVNGDGIDDILIGTYFADPPSLPAGSNAGIVYAVFGKNLTGSVLAFGDVDLSLISTGSALGFRILGATVGDQLGLSVSRAGDVNHDGISDVVVGARNADPENLAANSNAGISYVIFGRKVTAPVNAFADIQLTSAALPSAVGFRILGTAVNDLSGFSVSDAGDINGDGIDDFLISAMNADPPTLSADSNAGITYVIYGRDVASGAPAFGDIQLSSIMTGSAVGFRVLGANRDDNSGSRVSNAGDINGDGISDIVIGAYNADPQPNKANAGISYVIYGRKSSLGVNPFSDVDLAALSLGSSVGFRILGAAAQDRSGVSVSCGGDVNGDGMDDIVIGTLSGPSYVIYGAPVSPTSQPSSQPSRQPSRQPSSRPTFQPSDQPSSQPSGQPSRQPSTQPSAQPSTQPSQQPSRQPSSQPTLQPTSAPSTQELSLNHLNSARGFTMIAGGGSVSSAGDFNGDGIDDIIMGVPLANGNNGRGYMLFGRKDVTMENVDMPTFVTGHNTGFRILPAGSGGRLGSSVTVAGDVNGDGIDDVIVGARSASPSPGRVSSGISYVIFGRKVTSSANAFTDIQLTTTAMAAGVGFRVLGAATDDASGYSVSGAGDINGDGIDDVVIGAYAADPPNLPSGSNAGIVYVVFGKNMTGSALAFGDVDLSLMVSGSTVGFRILGSAATDQLGVYVGHAGDINNDGFSDVVVGANLADPTDVNGGGITYVIFGRKVTSPVDAFEDIQLVDSPLPSNTGFRVLGGVIGGNSGTSVSHAGDVNGDGMDDVIIGAPSARVVYVIFGRNIPGGATPFTDIQLTNTALPASIGFRILGGSLDSFGFSVAGVGDVNDDGVDDVLVGARYVDPSGKSNAGVSYVVYGRKSINGAAVFGDVNLASMAYGSLIGFRILGASAGDLSGSTVSGAGDFNGDGVADMMVGTPSRNSYVIYGTPANPTSQPSSQPSLQPFTVPSSQPSLQPSHQPVSSPTSQPSRQPSGQPRFQPSTQPSCQPSRQPSALPTLQPSVLPSGQPSRQPSSLPSAQPTRQPSTQPWSAPSSQPSQQPIAEPTCQPSSQPTCSPSMQPASQPTLSPSTQPSSRPSSGPTTHPSVHPSAKPSTQPTHAPTGQPRGQPTAQPSSRPSGQPTSQPSRQPSDQPSAQPTRAPTMSPFSRPTSQPSEQPSCQPSCQPSLQPQGAPTSLPTTSPTSLPTIEVIVDTWMTPVDVIPSISQLSLVNYDLWVCGQGQGNAGAMCAVLTSPNGGLLTDYKLPWSDVFEVMQVDDPSRVVVTGRIVYPSSLVTSEVANCVAGVSQLTCTAKSFYDTAFTAAAYVPFPKKFMYTGLYGTFATVSIEDAATRSVQSYVYTSRTMQSVSISHAAAPPSFVGAFVTGTCVSLNGVINYIVSGMVRTDSGAMSAVYLAPMSGSILNTVDLMTAMVLEFVNPDTFISGGLQLSASSGKHAYLLRLNSLIGSVNYGKRYRASTTGTATTESRRRTLGETVAFNSVTRGMVLVNSVIYMIVDVDRTNDITQSHIAVLKVDMETGLILQQVHLSSPNASLTCTDIAISTEFFLHLACSIVSSVKTESIIITTTSALLFSNLPFDLKKETNVAFVEESTSFQRFALPVTAKVTLSLISDYTLPATGAGPTIQPSLVPTRKPSAIPSVQPTGQPSSSPTAMPSVSPQPTSHPSSSRPTNTYKPTAKPTQQPSTTPSIKPSLTPSGQPTLRPTTQPTLWPSTQPSLQPSFIRTSTPTRAPSVKNTLKPSAAPSILLTLVPSPAVTTLDPAGASGKGNNDSDLVMVIGGSVLGGVLALWLFSRLFRWYLHEVHSHAKKRDIYLQLYATRVLQAEKLATTFEPPQRNRGSRKKKERTQSPRAIPAELTGAYASGPLSTVQDTPELNPDQSDPYAVDHDEEAAPPAASVHSSSSSGSSLVLSSLHSSERSEMNEQYFPPKMRHKNTVKQSKSRENVMEEGLTIHNTPSEDASENHSDSESDMSNGEMESDYADEEFSEEESSDEESSDEHSVSSDDVSTLDTT